MKKIVLALAIAALIASPAYADYANRVIVGSDNFDSYANGALVGQGPWTGTAPDTDIFVDSGNVGINVNALDYTEAYWNIPDIGPGAGNRLWVRLDISLGSGTAGNMWSFQADAEAWDGSNNFARLYGPPTSARPRIDGYGLVLNPFTLTGGWDRFEFIIDTAATTSEFIVNGVSQGTLNYSVTGAYPALGTLWFDSWNREMTDGVVWFDNLAYGYINDVPEPSSLAAFAMFGLGALGFIKRRRA